MADNVSPSGGRASRQASLWQSRQIAVAVLAGSLFIAGAIAAVGLDDDDDAAIDLLPTTTLTTAETRDTTTTTDADAPAPPSTSTTVVSGPTTSVAANTTTTEGQTPTPQPSDSCGNGSVRGEPRSGQVSQTSNGWETPINGLVVSDYDRPIEVTSFVIRVIFQDGTDRLVSLDTGGVVVPPGDAHTYDGPTITSNSPPMEVQVAELSYQPEGRPDCNTAA